MTHVGTRIRSQPRPPRRAMKAMLLRRIAPDRVRRRWNWSICRRPSRRRARCGFASAAAPSAAPICTSSRAICRSRKCPSSPATRSSARRQTRPAAVRLRKAGAKRPTAATVQLGPAGRRGLAAAYVRPMRVLPRGQENLCESARFTGYHADGGYAEYAVAPADFVYDLPANSLPSPFGKGATKGLPAWERGRG